MALSARMRTALRRLLVVLLLMLALVTLPLLALQLPAVRGYVLGQLVQQAQEALPGSVQVGRAVWPSREHLLLEHLRWTHDGRLLAVVDRLEMRWSLAALLRRDLRIEQLELQVARLDVPAMQSAWRQSTVATPASEARDSSGDIPLLRDGAVSGVPSVALQHVQVTLADTRLSDSVHVEELSLRLQSDLSTGATPRLVLEELQVALSQPPVRIEAGSLQLDRRQAQLELRAWWQDSEAWRLALVADSVAADDIAVRVDLYPAQGAAARLLDLDATLQRRGEQVRGMQLQSALHIPGVETMRAWPLLHESLQDAPALQGMTLRTTGSMSWSPRWDVTLQTHIDANDWIAAGSGQLTVAADTLRLDAIDLQLADAQVQGQWQKTSNGMQGDLDLQVQGTGWMAALAPQLTPPDSLQVSVQASVSPEDGRLQAMVRGSVQQQGQRLDDLKLQVTGTDASFEDVDFDLQALSQDWQLSTAGRLQRDEVLHVDLQPLRVLHRPGATAVSAAGAPSDAATPSLVEWHPSRGLDCESVRVAGDIGRVVASGHWDATAGGTARIELSWPEPPEVLLDQWPDSLYAALHEAWRDNGVTEAAFDVQWGVPGDSVLAAVQGGFRLPGPRVFASLLPESLQVQDLDVLRGFVEAEAVQPESGLRWTAALDLSPTSWLDRTGAHVQGRHDSLFVDSLRVVWDGLDLHLRGVADSSAVDLRGELAWTADAFLQRLPIAELQTAVVDLGARWRITGSPEAPDIEAQADMRLASLWGAVPRATARVSMQEGVLHAARLEAPDGLVAQGIPWERLQLDVDAEERDGVAGTRSVLSLQGEQQDVRTALWWETHGDTLQVQADSLSLRLFDRTLRTDEATRFVRAGSHWKLLPMRMSGSLGTVQAHADLEAPDQAVLLDVDLSLPAQPDFLGLPSGLWPQALRLRLAATDNDSLSMFLQTRGLQLGDRVDVSLVSSLQATPDSTHFRIDVVDPQEALLQSAGLLPLEWGLQPVRLALQPDSLRLDAWLTGFPVPDVFQDPGSTVDYLRRAEAQRAAHMDGELHIGGTPASPRGWGTLRVRPRDEDLQQFAAHIFLALAQEGAPWGPALQSQLQRLSTGAVLEDAGARLAVWLQRDTLQVLDAAVHLPVDVGFEDGALRVDSGAQLTAALRAQELDLQQVSGLLPRRTRFGGIIDIDLQAAGPYEDPTLSGGLRFDDLSVQMADGSRARATGQIEVTGTGGDPGITGNVTVRDGLLRIPELPRTLLPVEGEALLLQAMAADSTTTRLLEAPRPQAPSRPAAADVQADSLTHEQRLAAATAGTESDVTVDFPGAFWIRGRGFSVELSGNLQLTWRDGQARVVGELRAERGDLQLMASKFPIKSGRVMFFGDDETNPSLDLVMGRRYDNVEVEVVVSGTAKEPVIEFRSNPELPEEEILSYVLFGRGQSQLDDADAQRFDERMVALASLLTSNLGEGLRSRTGVDMLGLEQSSQTDDRASLVVGKYLSPRVLLKYVLDLEAGQGYSINVEYWLRGGLRLMTTTSRYSQSGLELNWSHDY